MRMPKKGSWAKAPARKKVPLYLSALIFLALLFRVIAPWYPGARSGSVFQIADYLCQTVIHGGAMQIAGSRTVPQVDYVGAGLIEYMNGHRPELTSGYQIEVVGGDIAGEKERFATHSAIVTAGSLKFGIRFRYNVWRGNYTVVGYRTL